MLPVQEHMDGSMLSKVAPFQNKLKDTEQGTLKFLYIGSTPGMVYALGVKNARNSCHTSQ